MTYFLMLQRREQALVVGAAALVLLLALFTFVIDPIRERAANLDRRLASAGRQLAELRSLRDDYRRQQRGDRPRGPAGCGRQRRDFRHFFVPGAGRGAERACRTRSSP